MSKYRIAVCLGSLIAAVLNLAIFPGDCLALAQTAPPSQPGSITGVVQPIAGASASGIRVTAIRVDAAGDALRVMPSPAQADSTGGYRIENVPPGRYYVAAGRVVDQPTYYPGTLDKTKGTIVSVTPGARIANIDVVIQDGSATLPPVAVQLVINAANGLNFVQGARRGAGTNPAPPPVSGSPFGVVVRGRGGDVGTNTSQPGLLWWTNAALVARLRLTEEQKKKIEATFDAHRQAIVQDKADLEREEAVLARLLEAEPMDSAKTVTAQIERVIRARGEMERTNSKMTLEIRQNLTRSQWVQLQAETQPAAAPVVNLPAGRSGGLRSGAPPAVPAAR